MLLWAASVVGGSFTNYITMGALIMGWWYLRLKQYAYILHFAYSLSMYLKVIVYSVFFPPHVPVVCESSLEVKMEFSACVVMSVLRTFGILEHFGF